MSLPYIAGQGPSGAKIVFVSDSPYPEELRQNRPFAGGWAKELERLCKDAGLDYNSAWKTHVCKHPVPPNMKGRRVPLGVRAKHIGIDFEAQLAALQVEINELKPNLIVGFGREALWALTGKDSIQQNRGSLLWGLGRKTISTYHPQGLMFQSVESPEFIGYWNRQVMLLDLKRAAKQAQFPDLNPPVRHLEICRNSAHLMEFYNHYKHLPNVSVDIEAGGHCLPICIGLAFTRHHGITVPLWNIQGISHIPTSDLVECWSLLTDILINHGIIGQNFNYDKDKIKRLGFRIKGVHSDVMMKSFAINPELPKNLALNISIFTEQAFYKDEGMYEGKTEDLLLGCALDACCTKEVDEEMDYPLDKLGMRPFYENFIMKLPEMYAEIESHGFRVDIETRNRLLSKYIEWDERLRFELFQLVGTEVNVNSPKQISLLLFETLGLPKRPGTGEEHLTSLLNLQSFTDVNKRRVVELILEDRRVRKSIGTYLMALPDYDGRVKTTCFACLDTGRSSNGMQDPPIRPTIEVIDENGKKKKKSLGAAFQTITKHGDIGADIRSMYLPLEEDEVFVQLDSEQAEARVMSLLANDEVMLARYDDHDIHALTASWFFGGNEAKYSKKVLGYECPERFIGKTLRHAGERGAKKARAASEVNTNARKYKVPIKISEADADRALKVFHKMCPNIERVYFKEIEEALKVNRRLIAPLPYGVDAPHGGVRIFFERWGDELFRQAFSYIPQRAVTDNTKGAALRIKPRFPQAKLILESHDALLYSIKFVDLEEFVPIAVEEMEREIDFSACSLPRHNIAIPCAVEFGKNYMQLDKYKIKRAEKRVQEPIIPSPIIVMTVSDTRTLTERFRA